MNKNDENKTTSITEKYDVFAGPIALAKIKEYISTVDISLIPEEDEDFSLFASAVISEIPPDSDVFNEIMRAITKTKDDFSEMSYQDATELLENFFVKLGPSYKKLILKKKYAVESQKDMAINMMADRWMDRIEKGDMIPNLKQKTDQESS